MLLSPSTHHAYSSMVPGYIRKAHTAAELAFELPPLAEAAGARFIEAAATDVDGGARIVRTASDTLEFDVCSLDVGAEPAGLELPGVAEYACTVRPMGRALQLRQRLDALIARAHGSLAVCVVGGGVGGVELACALAARLAGSAFGGEVHLAHAEAEILDGFEPGVRRLARRLLAARGVQVRTGVRATQVHADAVELVSGERLPSVLTVWMAGPAPSGVIRRSSLPRSRDGLVLVDDTLRATDGSPVWSAGDCVTLRSHPDTPKAGVHAVREAPVLAHNLRVELTGEGTNRSYEPQARFLAILDTADGRALLRWRGLSIHSRPSRWLKEWIDRRFMRRHRPVRLTAPRSLTS